MIVSLFGCAEMLRRAVGIDPETRNMSIAAAPFALSLDELQSALTMVHSVMPPTPQYRWPQLCEDAGADVWVKHENHTPTGAFKVRGGLVYFDRLRRERPEVRAVIAATRGNHGQSVAFAAARNGIAATVVVPHGNSVEKNAAMRAFGATLIEHGVDFQAAFERARELAGERGWDLVPSFHRELVRGVASYALELFTAVRPLDAVYVPVGLGSGICGLIAVRDLLGLPVDIIGVVNDRYPAYAESFASGSVVATAGAPPTIADGVACRVPDADAFGIIARGAARVIAVSEEAVEDAMRRIYVMTHNVAEGGGAIAYAGLLAEREAMRGKRVAVVLSGGNVDREAFARILRG